MMPTPPGSAGLLDAGTTATEEDSGVADRVPGALRFGVLGPLDVNDGVSARTPRAHKLRVLLAIFLVRRNTLVPIDSLMYGLWGDSPPRTALKALRVYVSQLRMFIKEASGGTPAGGTGPQLMTLEPGYRLDIGGAAFDAAEFDRLRRLGGAARQERDLELAARYYLQAISLWRGPALADVRSSPLLEGTALGLEESRISVLEQWIDGEIRLGRHVDAIAALRAMTGEYRLHEKVHAQLMIALYLAGRKADALETYRGLHATLVEELGVEPTRRLQLLHQAILTADDHLLAQWDTATW
jgi:SARP family transcriptional regulator, regulator of embCAB operon